MSRRKTTAFFASAAFAVLLAAPAFAQGMMGSQYVGTNSAVQDTSETGKDEAAGLAIWQNLKDGKVTCAALTDDDFDLLGDYFMGIMAGGTASHDAMNRAMAQRLGDAGEKQMHVIMGKRASGCDSAAAYPAGTGGFWTMMGGNTDGTGGSAYRPMMDGSAYRWPGRSASPVIGFGSELHWTMLVTLALVWTVLVLSVIALLTWITKQKK